MDSTSITLLRRLRESNEEAVWQRFVDLYAPLILHRGRHQGQGAADADDLVQHLMAVLIVQLPKFEYNPRQSFRASLKTVALNKPRDLQRRMQSSQMRTVHQLIRSLSRTNSTCSRNGNIAVISLANRSN